MAKEKKVKAVRQGSPQADGALMNLPLGDLIPTPDNPRRLPTKDDPGIRELVESIKARGVLQPVLARPHPTQPGRFDMRFGLRRLVAAKAAGLTHIPVVVREMDDREAIEATVMENLQREDVTAIEEGEGVAMLLEKGWDAPSIADHLGKSVAWVHRRGRLKNLSADWRKAIEEDENYGEWSIAVIEAIASLPPESQKQALDSIGSQCSSKMVMAMVADLCREIRHAPWKKDDVTLVPSRGACSACENRSCFTPGLFDDSDPYADEKLKKGDRCLNAACWDEKLAAQIERRRAELREKNGELLLVCESGYNDTPFKDVVASYTLAKAAKGDPGAKCALFVDGPKAGTTFWVSAGSSPSTRGGRAKGDAGEKQASTLAERKEKLDWRRKAWVADQVKKMLLTVTENTNGEPEVFERLLRPGREELMTLAAIFGAAGDRSEDWGKAASLSASAHAADIDGALWLAVAEGLRALLASKGFQKDPMERYKDAVEICKYGQVDVAALDKAAEDRFPVPKIWAKLNKDGSTKSKEPKCAT